MRKSQASHTPHMEDALKVFHPAVRDWFHSSFAAPTKPQEFGWPPISRGESTLILAPTGTGKTLSAFLWCIHRLMFERLPEKHRRCRIVYISPLKALAVDVERNLRAPLVGIANVCQVGGVPYVMPAVSIRTGDTSGPERARFGREPSDVLITTPESIYLLLTSNARDALRSVDTVIVDEIHALVPTKRGAHLALSLERLQALVDRPLQRIGLSATQRPLEQIARYLGGVEPGSILSQASGVEKKKLENGKWKLAEQTRVPNFQCPISSSQFPVSIGPEADLHDEFESDADPVAYRPVTIVDARQPKRLELRIEVPVEDMARLGQIIDIPSGPASQGPVRASIWTAIHPKLLNLIRQHQSTLIFVNSRRLAERMAAALNDLAGETLVRAHHGSLAPAQRREIEDRLKAGGLRGLVATSSLELGIDMGAVDLVVQVEAPPSVAAGIQRIGRGGHHVNAVSRGIIFPKYRADLVACVAATQAMREGQIEATRYPRNPLDVLAQQIVAMASMDAWKVEELFSIVRRATPYANLSRQIFAGVLDMLAGRYPSDEFAELRPRLVWDRLKNTVTGREGSRRVAVINGGTIPDRGLYGVFLAGAGKGSARVGELDEEMVFESRTGETFILGASTWRIEEITHDRVLVSPAPGEPGKMPFWHGDAAGRPLEFGQTIGQLVRALRGMPANAAINKLTGDHALDQNAAENLMRYLVDQAAATKAVPDDQTVVIERFRDEMGDWRVCLMTPFGGRIHAPWSMAATAKIRAETHIEVETMWTDDGFVVRFPETEEPPDTTLLIPAADEVENLVVRQLGSTALFAAKFREAAARALLLPRRRPGGRTPLWQQRKRAADLLAVAARFGSFPILLETYRECLRDVFDIPALSSTLRRIANRSVQVVAVDSSAPSPFAASLLFGYVANYIYDGDAPLPERRAQALTIDQAQLRELLGDVDLRELLDATALGEVESQLQALEEGYRARSVDGLHDLLRRLGDLSQEEIEGRSVPRCGIAKSISALVRARRAVAVRICGEVRYIAVEDASRYRDALGIPLPSGIPEAFLEPVPDAAADLVRRYARTHGPFTTDAVVARFGVSRAQAETHLIRLVTAGKLLEGEFRPGGIHREWCDAEVLRMVRRRSLAKLRHEVEPVGTQALGRLITNWQGVVTPRRGLDALLDTIESLQGAALPASIVETEILPSRIQNYTPADLDTLMAAGEVIWCGVEPLGERDGRIALFLADHLPQLWGFGVGDPGGRSAETTLETRNPNPESRIPSSGTVIRPEEELPERASRIADFLRRNGASFFAAIHQAAGAGFPGETNKALWDLVWRRLVTNDAFGALRAFTARGSSRIRRRAVNPALPGSFRSRRMASPSSQGRWSLIESRIMASPSVTAKSAALTQQLLNRYGLITREAAAAENIPGGFGAIYPVLKAMEESGRVRRGYFVAGVGATQFALPAALDLLRSLREPPETPEVVHLAAADPANPYGTILKWPPADSSQSPLARVLGGKVILVDGMLAAYWRKGNPQISVFLPDEEPNRSRVARALAAALREVALRGRQLATPGDHHGRGLLIGQIGLTPVMSHPLAPFLLEAGFVSGTLGYHVPTTSGQ